MYILVDASIIIKLNEVNKWCPFINSHSVGIPGVVISNEALFTKTGAVRRNSIISSIAESISNGVVRRFDASPQELIQINQYFADWVLYGIHEGEHEGLALMLTPACDEFYWCCSDKLAYKAAGMLGLSERCICLEESLSSIGHGCSLPYEYSREFMDRYVAEGTENKITGYGIRTSD